MRMLQLLSNRMGRAPSARWPSVMWCEDGGPSPALLRRTSSAQRRSAPAVPESPSFLRHNRRSRALAVEPSGIPSDELRRLIEADIKLTAEVVKAANLTFEE